MLTLELALLAARLAESPTEAAALIRCYPVKLNGLPITTPNLPLKPGDIVALVIPTSTIHLQIHDGGITRTQYYHLAKRPRTSHTLH